ncbi:MAG TPA: type 1 glutamine amidotransferase, partial [Chthoniobacteraceae bacterium]
LETIHAWDGERIPGDLAQWSGFAVGGGSMSVYEADQYPWLRPTEQLIRAGYEQRRPFLGMCLGAQLLASALGGRVFANFAKEIGLHELNFAPAAETDPLWKGHTHGLRPVHWHGDTFSLPGGAVLLASSAMTENQLFRVREVLYGFQFHLEIDLPLLTSMVALDEEALRENGVDPADFVTAAEAALPSVEPVARKVFGRWADLLR